MLKRPSKTIPGGGDDGAAQLKLNGDIMADRFLVAWFDDGNPTTTAHATSAAAFDRAKELFQQHGPDVEVEIHLNQLGRVVFSGSLGSSLPYSIARS
jgi:hypothetical protein